MHVGYLVPLQNDGTQQDADVYAGDLALADLAVELGFDSLWAFEHHFTDYIVSPDPLQLLTWLGSRHRHVQLGTAVVVLPWHDPVRCAERIAQLDLLSGGRLLLGIGRGIARSEYEGLRVPMERSRERFVAYAEMVLGALETGWIEARSDGLIVQPRREIRPRPARSFRGRTFAAASSPESIPIMARLGAGIFAITQKPWDAVREDFQEFGRAWRDIHGPDSAPPAPMASCQIVVDRDPERARELAFRHIGRYYRDVMAHYGFAEHAHRGVTGFEFYAKISQYIDRHGPDGAVADFVRLHPWGTPEQVLEKIAFLRSDLGIEGIQLSFSVSGLPYGDVEKSLRLFAAEVMPVLRTW